MIYSAVTKNLTKTKTDKLIDQTRTKFKTVAIVTCINIPSANNKKKVIQQQLQRREAEWAVSVNYLEVMLQEERLEGINLSYESLSQQKLQLDKLSDDLFKYNLAQNELKEIMEKSAERSLVILKWKKYPKGHSREVTTDSDSHLPERQRRAQPQQNNSQNDEPSTNHKSYYNRQQNTYNLRNKSKAESSTEKVTTLPASEKQQQSSRNPQMDREMTMT